MNAETITDTDFVTTIDFEQTLEMMIEAGKYNWKNDYITAKNFPVKGTGIKKYRTKLFRFDGYISSEDAVAAIKEEGFEPATHVHGLAFGAMFPDEQRKYPIACLGSSARVSGDRYVVCLYRFDVSRGLGLYYWSDGWHIGWYGNWRFLGIQDISAT